METLELANVQRYIRAIHDLTKSPAAEVRIFARELISDMSAPGVSVTEVLRPIINLPVVHLLPLERLLRSHANGQRFRVPAVQDNPSFDVRDPQTTCPRYVDGGR